MLTYTQAIILGALQGATELFPVSSLGHSVILPQLLGWNVDQNADFFLSFLVAAHLATSLVLFAFFFKDWVKIIKGLFRSLLRFRIEPGDTYARLGWLLVAATVPAGLLGLALERKLKLLFAAPALVASMLILNGILLYGAEFLRSKGGCAAEARSDEALSGLSWKKALKVGLAQCLALIPGFSRTGATVGGGLLVGLDHKSAARFSFLLATPIIFAAAALKLPGLAKTASPHSLGVTLAGAIVAAIAAYLSVRFLTKYFETKTLKPFAAYCIVAGLLSLIVLAF